MLLSIHLLHAFYILGVLTWLHMHQKLFRIEIIIKKKCFQTLCHACTFGFKQYFFLSGTGFDEEAALLGAGREFALMKTASGKVRVSILWNAIKINFGTDLTWALMGFFFLGNSGTLEGEPGGTSSKLVVSPMCFFPLVCPLKPTIPNEHFYVVGCSQIYQLFGCTQALK